MSLVFFTEAVLLGTGLAMDAFSVSAADGLGEPDMSNNKTLLIAGTFGVFQFLMPLIGFICVRSFAETFGFFYGIIPYISLLLLGCIGAKMLVEGIKNKDDDEADGKLTFFVIFVQGIATAIDALSVGFAIADYTVKLAVTESLIIGIITFFICITGIKIGKVFGNRFKRTASVLGGTILIFIGFEIFIKGII